jgi:biopolymer transport protein ExbD
LNVVFVILMIFVSFVVASCKLRIAASLQVSACSAFSTRFALNVVFVILAIFVSFVVASCKLRIAASLPSQRAPRSLRGLR